MHNFINQESKRVEANVQHHSLVDVYENLFKIQFDDEFVCELKNVIKRYDETTCNRILNHAFDIAATKNFVDSMDFILAILNTNDILNIESRPTNLSQSALLALQKFKIALIYKNMGDQEKDLNLASSHFENAIRANPRFAQPYCKLGDISYKKGEFDIAIYYYNSALGLNPNLYYACFMRARIHNKRGLLADALSDLFKVKSLNENFPYINYNITKVCYNLSYSLYKNNKIENAFDYFEETLDYNPEVIGDCYDLINKMYFLNSSINGLKRYKSNLEFILEVSKEFWDHTTTAKAAFSLKIVDEILKLKQKNSTKKIDVRDIIKKVMFSYDLQ